MSEQAGLPGAQKSLALLEKLKRRVHGAADADAPPVPVAPASSTRSGRVPGVRSAAAPAPSAPPALPTPRLPPAPTSQAPPTKPLPSAPPAARAAPVAAPVAAAAPLTVRGRLDAVNWAREARKPVAPAAQATEVAAQAMTVRARLNAVNWERAAIKPASAGAQPGQTSGEPAPLSTVESFFSEIQW